MTTWTLEQIRQAEGLRFKVAIDTDHAHVDEMKRAAASKMARGLVSEAHAFAIELHEADLSLQWTTDDDQPWREWGVMRWHPNVREVELCGGPEDGQRLEIQRVGEPLRVAVMAPWNPYEVTSEPDVLLPSSITYKLTGWREDERVWVYATR